MEFDARMLMQRTDDVKLAKEIERKHLMTFHCSQCNMVLGDSLSVCGEMTCIDSFILFKVSDDVIVCDKVKSEQEGTFTNCIYSSLACSGCQSDVGIVIHSAPHHLDRLRSTFLLHKENINCYILNSTSMVKASQLKFDLKPLGESLSQIKQQFQAQFYHMSCIKTRFCVKGIASDTD